MLFNSLQFILFFTIVYCIYLQLHRKTQNVFLLISSYVFYSAWDYRFLSLILISTVVDYYCGMRIYRSTSASSRKWFLITSLIANLSILGFFKYFNFFFESLFEILLLFNVSASFNTLSILLPVGISFYTFQTMSYTIDIYYRRMKPCTSLIDFALFVSFFPQLVAGPIERAKNLLPQIQATRHINYEHLANGLYLVLWGLFKKVVIADNLAVTVDQVFLKNSGFLPNEVFIGVLFFTIQIYCDFSGYTDIARGIAKLMGFELMLNFNLPYFAKNPGDFWRRWHISLSTWLKDYLYVPIGGNRKGLFYTYRNLMVTMILGGLWHGAAWNFVLWGLYHGILLSIHRLLRDVGLLKLKLDTYSLTGRITEFASISLMFGFTLYGWLLFRASNIDQIIDMTKYLTKIQLNQYLFHQLAKLTFYSWPLAAMWGAQYSGNLKIFLRSPVAIQTICYVIMMFLFIVIGNFNGTSFIYFQF
jgi:alginate O-acetyltransferase complex protein AlgI